MIVQRIRGIRSLLAFAQAALATALFWLCLALVAGFISPGTGAFIRDYAIYWGVLLAGLGLEMLSWSPDKVIAPIFDSSLVSKFPVAFEHHLQFAEVLSNDPLRTFIKPGITGLTQLRGFRGEARTSADISARPQSDLIYLENRSLSLDLSIILRTLWQMIRPPRTAV